MALASASEDVDPALPGQQRPRMRAWRLGGLTPLRLLLGVGIPMGLAFVVLLPPWLGYDERTHFERSYDIAGGNLTPQDTVEGVGSWVPRSLQQDLATWWASYMERGEPPWSPGAIATMLRNRPNPDQVTFAETQPTNASTPLGYLPASVAMAPARQWRAPMLATLWAGRGANLAVYLAVGALALQVARAFRWTLALGLLYPLNLQQGATVSPDGLTIAGVVLVLAVWTHHRAAGDDGAPNAGRAELGQRAALVGGSCLLLALAKPPYFLVAALFATVVVAGHRARRDWIAAASAVSATLVGVAWVLVNSTRYQAVTETLERTIVHQPDVQRDRLLADPLGFLGAMVTTLFGDFHHYVQDWSRHLGGFPLRLPALAAWVVLGVAVMGAAWLDRRDLLGLGGRERATAVVTAAGLVTLLYVSAWMYFEDRPSFSHLRLQGRYLLPLFPLAVMALVPRGRLARRVASRLTPPTQAWMDRAAPVAVVATLATIGVAAVVTWVGGTDL